MPSDPTKLSFSILGLLNGEAQGMPAVIVLAVLVLAAILIRRRV